MKIGKIVQELKRIIDNPVSYQAVNQMNPGGNGVSSESAESRAARKALKILEEYSIYE